MKRALHKWWLSVDRYIITGILILLSIGIALVMAASPTVAQRIGLSYFHFIQKQVLYIVMGISVMFVISLMPPITTRRLSILGCLVFFFLLIMVELMGFETKGAKRWIYLGGMSVQPSELLKPFFAVLTAWLITRKTMDSKFRGFMLSTIFFGLIAILLIRQPNFGMTLTMGVIWFTQMIIGGLNIFIIGGLGIAGIAGIFAAYHYLPHVHHRIELFLNAGSGDNYQTDRSLQAFENGGIFGTGPAQGKVKEILPDAHTDFIFSVAGEEFGLIFCLIIIALYCALIYRCLWRAYTDNDLFTILAVTGLTMQVFFQAAVNMGVAINLLPNTGITLPFISYGGSSMLSVSLVMGLILSFTRKKYN